MTDHSVEELDNKLSALDDLLPKLDPIGNAFWKTTATFQTLLDATTSTSSTVKTTSTIRRFTPTGLFYIDSIDFYAENNEKLASNLTVTIKPIGAQPYKLKLSLVDKATFAYGYVRKFCEWFEISSDSIIYKPTLKKISVFGCDSTLLSEYAKDIQQILDLKRSISAFKTTAKSEYQDILSETEKLTEESLNLTNSITITKEEIANLDAEQLLLKSALESSNKELTKLNLSVLNAENNLTNATNNTAQLKESAEKLNKQISNLNADLAKLTNDKNLISDEYGPYVKEGNTQAKIYLSLIILPLLAIIFSVYQVYVGATNLLAAQYTSFMDVLAAFILRIPFAAIFGLAIIYSWKLALAMIQKVFKIHSDRLTLAKLLVVARETVHSSAKNLDITDHEKFQEQTALKIEVLKSHMARDLNEGFSYKPVPNQKQPVKEASAEASPEAVNDEFVPQDVKSPA